ncbi:recombinase family protein [Crassaminicella indica]|uniref:Recombinase family protein n=1 Tax=Crassaminicella indica TaxID=2855394 RepID=A0ABX8RDM7_9CLOT|nr:recombinase family protein [Crassaminicella indica]
MHIKKLFIDKCSSKNTNRSKLKALMEYAREVNIIHLESFNRLVRITKDLLSSLKVQALAW